MSHECTDGLEVKERVIGITQVEWCLRGGRDPVADSVDSRRLRLLPGLRRINIDIHLPFSGYCTLLAKRDSREGVGVHNAFTGAIAGAAIGFLNISASSCAY